MVIANSKYEVWPVHNNDDIHTFAADAAAERFARAPADSPAEEEQPGTSVQYTVARLVELVIRHVSGRICDSRVPIVGLHVSTGFSFLFFFYPLESVVYFMYWQYVRVDDLWYISDVVNDRD